MNKLRLLADARREFHQQITWYEAQRPGLGKRFRLAAEAALIQADDKPGHGKPGVGGTRR